MSKELIERLHVMGLHKAADALEAKAAPVGEREAYEAWKLSMKPYGFDGFDAYQAGAAYQRQQALGVMPKLVECWKLADQLTNGSHLDEAPNHDDDSLYELVDRNDPRRLRLQAERADVLEKMLTKQISRLNGKEVDK